MFKNEFSEIDLTEKKYGTNPKNIFVHIMQHLFSFELLFILFLFAWVYKIDPSLAWIPIDLTQLFFILSVFSGILVFLGEKKRLKKKAAAIILCGIIFVFYVLISLYWTPGDLYAHQKALNISTLTLWALIAGVLIASDKVRLTRFINLILVLTIWIAIESIVDYTTNGPDVINLNSNYLALGYTLDMGVLICAAYGFLSGAGFAKRLFMIMLSLFFMFVLFILGGRGPLISAMISLLVPLFFGGKLAESNKLKLKKYAVFIGILFLIIILISFYLYYKGLFTATLYRMSLLLDPGMGSSAGVRIDYYSVSEKLWLSNPILGYGIGSWPIRNGLPDAYSYPHNMIFEILVELGLVGLILFGLIFLFSLKGFIKQNYNRNFLLGSIVLMMLVNAFIGAMFSGDINDNRILFAIFGLMALKENKHEE